MQLFDATNIELLEWPDTEEGRYAQRFLEPLVKNGIKYYINNIQARIFALKIEQCVLPIVVADENYENSHICSPYGQYVSYAKESLGLIKSQIVAELTKNCLNGLGKIVRFGHINSVVYVNHWLFATNLYSRGISKEQVASIVTLLKQHFPKHAIVFRSLNLMTNTFLIESLKNLKFHLIASRQVYLTDTKNESVFQTRILKSDLKLWREKHYEVIDEEQISSEDYSHLLHLYNSLYLAEHSYLNPQFNHQFIQLLCEQRLLRFKVLKLNGEIKGVAGYFERSGIMLCPFFGYDKNDPHHTVIYRLLSTSLLLEAKKQGLIFHQSSGASFYKTVRRAESYLDWMAVYTDHLSLKQKFSWSTLQVFINTFAPRYMKKY